MKFILTVLCVSVLSQISGQELWSRINDNDVEGKSVKAREIVPEVYDVFQLDERAFIKATSKIKDNKGSGQEAGILLQLPLPGGALEEFYFTPTNCMNEGLAAKFPNIQTFRAVATNSDYTHARVDIGTMGFHAVISTPKGTVYIDPYFADPDNNYIVYYVKDHKVDASQYGGACGTHDYMDAMHEEQMKFEGKHVELNPRKSRQGEEVVKHTYRLAVTTTGEWGRNYGTVENVLSRVVTGVNRLNMIFENEIAVTFELIEDNDQLIFLDPETDPFTDANQGRLLIGQNSIAINNIIGNSAYDIGHVFTVRCIDGVAGIAALGSVCLNNKGNGVSCVGGSNISFFMVNTTAHEIGHQFNGGHSWSNCPSAMGQLSPGTAWEPGSGSTILSYAGVCGSQNILGTNDDYFHVGNLQQFLTFISTTGSCAESVLSGNHAPDLEVPLGDGVTIPIATPFELTGIAVDEDGDDLTYNWEQMDTGPTSPLGNPEGNAPSFRSFPPTSNPTRVFPRLPAIIGGIGSNLEVLPLYSRDLTFRFTVKDNHPGAGITVWEEIAFRSSDTAGPFRITSPSSLTFVEVGEELTVEWDVANTDNEIIDCQFVDIYFSDDEGANFDVLLLQNTPNDGSATVEIPNMLTNEGKIKVKASNNIFFQLNRSNIVVREPAAPGFFLDLETSELEVCIPDPVNIEVSGTAFQSFEEPVMLDIVNAPQGLDYSFSNNPMQPDGNSVLTINFDNITSSQMFELEIRGIAENADTITQFLLIDATGTSYEDLALNGPESGLSDVRQIPEFEWTEAGNADYYTLQIATSPKFDETIVFEEDFLVVNNFVPQIVLDNSQLYYWRVIANNSCSSSASQVRTFGTASLDCREYAAENLPRNISFSGSVTVDGVVKVFDSGVVADVNVKNIKGQHSNIFQLSGSLISPSGTEVTMFDRDCFAATDFNIGFDNESPRDFTCPLNTGLVMKPNEGDLNEFVGEDIEGDWTFRIQDNQGGDGGQFTDFVLELCASFPAENPFLVTNDLLEVPTGLSRRIGADVLQVSDNNNSDSELIYTLVILPENGELSLNGMPLSLGDQFSQTDLNNRLLRYTHLGSENEEDSFVFTVIDGEGGWLDLTEFEIFIDEDVISSNSEVFNNDAFQVYPNPTSGWLNVRSRVYGESLTISIFSASGQRVVQQQIQSGEQIDLSLLQSGLYLVHATNGNQIGNYKINVIK